MTTGEPSDRGEWRGGRSAKGTAVAGRPVRQRRVNCFDSDPAAGDLQILEIRNDDRSGHERVQRRLIRRDAIERCHVSLVVGREFSAVVVVRCEVLVDDRVLMVRVRVVAMRLWQRPGEGEARDQ